MFIDRYRYVWITPGASGANSPPNHTLKRWLSTLCSHEMPLCGRSLPCRALPVATAAATWDNHQPWKPRALPGLAPPVPHAGCIFRSLSALVKTEGISPARSAFPGSPVSLERSQTETSPQAGSGTDQQVSWECLSGSQRCSLPSPWLSLRFVALLLSCCYCHPPHTPPTTHQAPRPFLGTFLNPRDSLYRN